ncbi:MAG: hypothetical protein ACRC62_39335 [Microcoleus sp.]
MINIQQILDEQNLVPYGAAKILSAQTGKPLKTHHQQIRNWIEVPPVMWRDLETFLNAMGYDLVIKKRSP